MAEETSSKEKKPDLSVRDWRFWTVWLLRLILGGVFIMSGLMKAVDLWGTVYKFEEYFTLWGWNMPMPLTVMASMMLCSAEFLVGAMMLLGNYRRTAVWFALAIMAVMLPLTLYIWIADPVSDCGCFGDYLKLSNAATFWKNVALVAGLVMLARYNTRVKGAYHPYSQWITAVAVLVYVTAIELFGFNVQPLLDFRSFPVGTSLVASDEEDGGNDDFVFIYEKDGQEKEFTTDALPDSTWTFVDRRKANGAEESEDMPTELTVNDEDGEDVTADVIAGEGPELLVVIPQHERADLYYNAYINDLSNVMNSVDGSLVELTDADTGSLADSVNVTLADYPIFRAESTVLKELSRGLVSVVMLSDGKIVWKRNMGSIDIDSVVSSDKPLQALAELKIDGPGILEKWTTCLLCLLAVLFLLDHALQLLINRRKDGKAENNCVNLQDESASPAQEDSTDSEKSNT